MVTYDKIKEASEKIFRMINILDTVENVLEKTGRTDIWSGKIHMSEQLRIDLCYFLIKLSVASSREIPQECLDAFSIILGFDFSEEDICDVVRESDEITEENFFSVPLILEVAIETEIFFRESQLCNSDNLPKRIHKIFGEIGRLYLDIYEPDKEQIQVYSDYMMFALIRPITQAGLME